jgi:OOP family OmpA-OmpF porin
MKKNTLIAVLLLSVTSVFAQEDFNKWSIDFGAGVNKATEPYTTGFDQNQISDLAVEVGARYMFNDRFGLRADFGYADIKSSNSSIADFQSEFMRFGIQGVANIGTLLNFRDFTNRFNLLGHAGVTYGRNDTEFASETDQFVGITAGITPQFKITERFALNLNLTAMAFDSADLTWDGASSGVRQGFDHNMFTATLGLSVYLGSADQHADFVDNSKTKQLEKEVEEIEGRLAKLESDMQDDDRDGIPNYIDVESNTPTGITVDSKGRAVDTNDNGIPMKWKSL